MPVALTAIDIAFAAAALIAALAAAGHAVIYKRDPRSAALWLIVIGLLPAVGAVLYALLGVNRVQRRAARLRRRHARLRAGRVPATTEPPASHLAPLARLVDQLTERPLVPGNLVEPLVDGREAFPAMLEAIRGARQSLVMASYIFDGDGIGTDFVEALGAAHARGVQVRVLIDDVDARFSRGSAVRPLQQRGVGVAVFNPTLVPARLHAVNLRNHRKILVVDGEAGFTGGINVDRRYWARAGADQPYRDLHFRLRGPVVAQLLDAFADDWHFATGETLQGPLWCPAPAAAGGCLARSIEAGPDEPYGRVRWALIGALQAAQRSVRIITPYFIPDTALVAALNAAAMRGVVIDIVLPQDSDLPHVHWATFAQLWQVLEHGCRVWAQPAPFDHSKLMVVDGAWTLLGSANWDARSLRLNFELNVECYSAELGAQLEALVEQRIAAARRVTLAEVDARALPVKLRDGIARLFAPYL